MLPNDTYRIITEVPEKSAYQFLRFHRLHWECYLPRRADQSGLVLRVFSIVGAGPKSKGWACIHMEDILAPEQWLCFLVDYLAGLKEIEHVGHFLTNLAVYFTKALGMGLLDFPPCNHQRYDQNVIVDE